jgi:asparagine synthase (glutamine-hydrolysing)
MHFSVESRVPFLDRSLVDSVLSFPEDMLLDEAGTTKSILRQALRGLVPDSVLARRDKIGFETPEEAWLGSQRTFLADAVRTAPSIGFLDSAAVAAGIDGSGPAARVIPAGLTWRLFNLYRWASLMGVDCS